MPLKMNHTALQPQEWKTMAYSAVYQTISQIALFEYGIKRKSVHSNYVFIWKTRNKGSLHYLLTENK